MTALLDTDVLINYLRGDAHAQKWLSAAGSEPFQVPGIAAMELVIGCRNAEELKRLTDFLAKFSLAWPDANETAHAYQLLVTHHLTTALSIPDCLIAALALSRQARLYTFNLRHYQKILGLDVQQPY